MTVTINGATGETTPGTTFTGSTSGTILVQAASVAGTNTVTVAAQTGTLNVAGPAFSAYNLGNQTVTANVWTKIVFNTKTFDTNNNYDNTTNYRFTPTVAGYYQINALVYFTTANQNSYIQLYKNGGSYLYGSSVTTGAGNASTFANFSAVVYANGSTDYFEIYGNTGGTAITGGSVVSNFSGCLIRGA